MVQDLIPLALGSVEHHGDRFLAVSVVTRNVEELVSRSRHAAPESVDEGGAHRAVLERQNGVVVGCTGEFGAVLGEAQDVLAQALSRLLLAVA
jgi:hypothetical protein